MGIPIEPKGTRILCSGPFEEYDIDLREMPGWMFVPHLPKEYAVERSADSVASAGRLYICKDEAGIHAAVRENGEHPLKQDRGSKHMPSIVLSESEMFDVICEPQVRYHWVELVDAYIMQGGCVGPWMCRALAMGRPLKILGESVWGESPADFVAGFRGLAANYAELMDTFLTQFEGLLEA